MIVQTNNTNREVGSSAFFIWKALKELGHEAHLAQELSDYDVIINVAGEVPVPPIAGKPSIYWDTDSFLQGPPEHIFWDYLFIGGCPEDLVRYPKDTVFLSHACDPEIHKVHEVEKEYDIVFVGNHSDLYQHRNKILETLKTKYKVHDVESSFGEEYAREMSRGKLIFNMSLGKKNIPMRFFEGMAIGTLLENYNDNLNAFATPHEHYIPYHNDQDLLDQIDYYLSHDDKRQEIAEKSRDHVVKNHTYKHRVETMLSYL